MTVHMRAQQYSPIVLQSQLNGPRQLQSQLNGPIELLAQVDMFVPLIIGSGPILDFSLASNSMYIGVVS
jgi:hypothetical protein